MFANIMKFVVALIFSLLGLFANAGAQVCTPAPNDLISFWAGDGNALDARSRNNPAQTLGSPQFVAAEVGQGMKFDGVNDGYVVPNNSSLDIGAADSFTLEAWLRADSLGGSGSVFHTIATKEDGTALYRLLLSDDGIFDFEIIDSVNDRQVFSGTVPAGSFNHVAAVLNRSANLLIIYLNGVQQSATDITGIGSLTNTGRFFIGHKSLDSGTGALSFNGVIDEVSTYNRALSASEIQAIVNAGTAGKCKPVSTVPPTGLVSWWPGDIDPSDVADGNSPVATLGAPLLVPGKVANGIKFDGSSGYELANASNLNFAAADSFSYEAWIRVDQVPTNTSIFLEKRNLPGPFGYILGVEGTSAGSLAGRAFVVIQSGGTTVSAESLSSVADGSFHHVAAVIDRGTQTLSIYVDSVLQGSAAINTIGSLTNTGNLYLGINTQDFTGSSAVGFNGVVDELSLYNRALTADEITSIFNAGSAGKVKPLGPTAAGVSISGCVITSSGAGISRASVRLTDGHGNVRNTYTSTFGLFSFDNITVGQTYILQVNSSRYRIMNNIQTITLKDEITGLEFISAGDGK